MSERMIELQRERMGLPPSITQPLSTTTIPATGPYSIGGPAVLSVGNSAGVSHHASVLASVPHGMYPSALGPNGASTSAAQKQASAAATLLSEDERMRCFLHLLAVSSSASPDNNDGDYQHISATSLSSDTTGTRSFRSAPTVPCSLSRRILHRQGAGYLDEAVEAIASGAADRFLATVLQQAVACRDQRLKGDELAKRERKELVRHRKRRKAQLKARRRKRKRVEKLRESRNLEAIAAEEAIRTSMGQSVPALDATDPTATSSGSKIKSKKKAKAAAVAATAAMYNGILPVEGGKISENGCKILPIEDGGSISEGDESLDAEEEYYENYYSDENADEESDMSDSSDANDDSENDCLAEEDEESEDEEDDSRFVLLMRDLARPLEAWGFSLTGKIGLGAVPVISAPPAPADAGGNASESDGDVVSASGRDIGDEATEEEMEEDDLDQTKKEEKDYSNSKTPPATPLKDGVNKKSSALQKKKSPGPARPASALSESKNPAPAASLTVSSPDHFGETNK